jgi:hypothetical protein
MSTAGSEQSKRSITDWHRLREWGGTNDADWLGDKAENPDPDDLAQAPYAATRDLGVPTTIRAVVVAFDASGDPLGHEGTLTVQPVEILDHPDGDIPIGAPSLTATIGRVFEFPLNGSERWTVRCTGLTSAHTDFDSAEVWYRIVRE